MAFGIRNAGMMMMMMMMNSLYGDDDPHMDDLAVIKPAGASSAGLG
jgi:hypothetical protein